MKKILFILLMVALSIGVYALITGSAHDFSGDAWSGGEICVPCHTPHGADTTIADAPLWNHELSVQVFTPYTSVTMQASPAPNDPDGISRLCLSCHDGTVAVDSFGGATGTVIYNDTNFPGRTAVPANLNSEHPISFTYDGTLETADGELNDPTSAPVAALLIGGQVECASCHDVHNTSVAAGTGLLRVTMTGSQLCLTCHAK